MIETAWQRLRGQRGHRQDIEAEVWNAIDAIKERERESEGKLEKVRR